jgi:hypothetical protein
MRQQCVISQDRLFYQQDVFTGFSFFGEFAKWRKATVSFVVSVRLYAWNNSGSHWTDFQEI